MNKVEAVHKDVFAVFCPQKKRFEFLPEDPDLGLWTVVYVKDQAPAVSYLMGKHEAVTFADRINKFS